MHQALQHTEKENREQYSDFRQISFYNLNSVEDCYSVFKLPQNVSEKKIKEKYIKLCNYYHPRRGINWKTKHFIRVVLAYQFIEKINKRRKQVGYVNAEAFFEDWKQQDMIHDLDKAFAYSKIKKEMFERLLYPGFYKFRSIVLSIFLFLVFLIAMIPLNEFWEGRSSFIAAFLFPVMLFPVIRNLLKTKSVEKEVNKKMREIQKY